MTVSEYIGRNVWALKRISEATGVNVLASTGWYTYPTYPTYVKKASVEQLADVMISEIMEGIGNTEIKAGVIGECAGSTPRPYHQQEKKVLQAACRAQAETGVGLTFHQQYRKEDFESDKIREKAYEYYVEMVEAEGADMNKFYLSHTEGTMFDLDYQCSMMDKGVTLGYDCFGYEYYYNYAITANSKEMDGRLLPIGYSDRRDSDRVKAVAELCRRGYERTICLSHDICHKTDLKKYGGHGYSHILETIVPWLVQEGVTRKQIRTMLVQNPRRILSR
jgi:phosphotriesterase-related protein